LPRGAGTLGSVVARMLLACRADAETDIMFETIAS
jgi:hypothetical protein